MCRIKRGTRRNNGVKTPKDAGKTFVEIRLSPEENGKKGGETPRRFG
jgi:hypothetical protein